MSNNNNQIERLIIIDQQLFDDKKFVDTLNENFNITVELQTNPDIFNNDNNDDDDFDRKNATITNNNIDFNDSNVLYISNSFEGLLFEKLLTNKKPIISDIIVDHCIKNRMSLPLPKYPLFNYFMKDFVICFSIDDKRKARTINKYLNLIRFMCGQSRRDMKSGKSFERTHLIESKTDSENYKLACIYGIPILYKEWIDYIWEHRRESNFDPNNEAILAKFRLKPLSGLRISLYNFPQDELEEKTKLIIENGGHSIPLYESDTTHLVVKNGQESSSTSSSSSSSSSSPLNYLDILENYAVLPKFVVSEKWLESSIQANYRNPEDDFLLKIPLNDKTSDNNHVENTPTKDSTLNSILLSPNYDNSIDDSSIADKNDLKKQAITQELYQTELNYVNILKDIIRIFRDPLKNHQMPGQFPNEIELKTMFGGLPPIIDVHEKILKELEPVVRDWKAENEIGKIFQKHKEDFLTVYPQYINFYEKTKETIEQCINKYPKFASFLKAGQTSSEFRKQTFQELLINPIQRLPRIELYLRTLLDRTDKLHPDYKLLNEALDTIISVNRSINIAKKKTEGQMELFELLNDIEDCPATLLSANRHFISKCDCKLLIQNSTTETDFTVHKLETALFSLLLFSDWIMVCKKRIVKRSNSLKDQIRTPNIPLSVSKKSKKTYRYIETIDLSNLKCILHEFDEHETLPDYIDAFALIVNTRLALINYPIYPFIVKDVEIKKDKFIHDVVEAYEILTENKIDDEIFLKKGSFKNLDFSHSKTIARSLNKSKYVFMRTKERLNRTFSMRRNNSNLLSVSMENLTSAIPLPAASPSSRLSRVFTNFNFFTPRENELYTNSQINSFNNIAELNNSTEVDDNFSLPATPSPRKKKMYQGAG